MFREDLIRKRIRSLREAAGTSQSDLAFKLGIDERSYARLERGERKQLDLHLLTEITSAMNTDLLNLLARHSRSKTCLKKSPNSRKKTTTSTL